VWFLAIVFTLYWTLGLVPDQGRDSGISGRRLQNALLLGASCVFYGWIHPWFLLLLGMSSITDFFAGQWMVRQPRYKTFFLVASMTVNLGILGYFKYFNFFIDSFDVALTSLGMAPPLVALQILLPVGVSFYTFQTMSYSIDIYRGELEPRTDPLDYFLYVMFFPQLVAGPIERAPNLLVQIERSRHFSWERVLSGVSLAMWGGFKKMCVADTLAPYIDKVFVLKDPSGPMIWAACVGFSVQIFADFSGYTDIARGTARTLGFELTENFKSPYLAASTPEFWQRWHISLSFWIRDYLLVPMLGSGPRLTTFRFVWATVLTFVVIGFWHGASWNFILFGLWHGVWLAFYTLLIRNLPPWTPQIPLGRPMAVVFHFFAVSVPGSLLFRETHVARIWQHLHQPLFDATHNEWMATAVLVGMTILAATPLVLSHFVERYLLPRIGHRTWVMLPLQTSSWAVFGMAIFVFYRVSASDFIYFQF
jgi:D-alanyl-lipoteichoic acid acyltransferase DltB (MBOAT superfamily)